MYVRSFGSCVRYQICQILVSCKLSDVSAAPSLLVPKDILEDSVLPVTFIFRKVRLLIYPILNVKLTMCSASVSPVCCLSKQVDTGVGGRRGWIKMPLIVFIGPSD